MSNADPQEVVTASSDGVSVEKSFEPDDFPVPAIAFAVTSERDESVSVRLVDDVPDHVQPEDIGFHPKYGAEFWGVEGDAIVFEREFDPEEEYTTVYGLRGGDAEDADKFMSEPEFESVDPPLEGGTDAGGVDAGDVDDGGQTAEGDETGNSSDEIATAIEDVDSGLSEDETDDADDIDIPEDIGGASSDDAAVSTGEAESDTASTEGVAENGSTSGTASTADENVAAALAAEVRAGDVDDDDLEDLRDALGVDAAGDAADAERGSVDARIEQLQSEVADLQAYTEALEGFLDENGDAQQLIADVRDDVESTGDRVDDVEETAAAAADDVEDLEAEFESFREDVGDETDERLSELEAEVDELSAKLNDVAEMRDRLTSALGGLAPQDDADGDDADGDDADD